MKKIGSILCDGQAVRKDFRRNVYLKDGRIICDGNDITPMSGKYPRGSAGVDAAQEDISAMYGRGPWELELV